MKKMITTVQDFKWSFHIILIGIFINLGFYMYCVSKAVHNVVSRNNVLITISKLQTEVSELETKYVAITNNMTLNTAEAMGLKEPKNKIFISKKSSREALSINQ